MANRKVVLRLSGCLVLFLCLLGLHMDVMSMSSAPAADESGRPDLVMIDVIAAQGPLELPAVQFLHDKHTAALEERGKDCSSCHKKDEEKGLMSLRFMRLEDGTAAQLKELYHNGCIGCHTQDKAAGEKKIGPQSGECRKCHVKTPTYELVRVSSGMDNTLHYRHWGSKGIPLDQGQETNCGACHHEYDKEKKELVYIKFQEEGCTTCHTDTLAPEGDVKTVRVDAFHQQCVTCHLNSREAKAEKFGPVDCAGCHGVAKSAEVVARNQTVLQELGGVLPRLPRKQPDAALLTAPVPLPGEKERPSTLPVAFNHKLHETQTASCADCHHNSMKPCGECHTLLGKEEGGFVSLEQAMHQTDSSRSCVGCHAVKQQDPSCAGCHAAMPASRVPAASSCAVCHVSPQPAAAPVAVQQPEVGADGLLPVPTQPVQAAEKFELPADKEARQALAARMVAERPTKPVLVAVDDIPEKVTIGVLAKDYKPSEMPHRQIVLKMMENMKDDSLATVFHATPLSMCSGCHHNSPQSKNPPACQSCHGEPFQEGRSGRPGLLAAYHGQCMDCHKEMRLEKPAATDCTACHQTKDNG